MSTLIMNNDHCMNIKLLALIVFIYDPEERIIIRMAANGYWVYLTSDLSHQTLLPLVVYLLSENAVAF